MVRERSNTGGRSDGAVRITTAAESRNAEIATRQKRYLVSMSLRSVCFVGAIIASLEHIGWLWPILIAAALILPYLAVVMANARHSLDDGFALVDGEFGRPELGPGSDSGPERPQRG